MGNGDQDGGTAVGREVYFYVNPSRIKVRLLISLETHGRKVACVSSWQSSASRRPHTAHLREK